MKDLKMMVLIACCITLGSCIADEPSLDRQDEFVNFRELAEDLTGCWLQHLEGDGPERSIVIRNEKELAHFINCEKVMGTVDFELEFILAGRVNLPQCGFLKSQTLELKNNRLQHTAEVEIALCQMPTAVDYFAVVPKEYLDFPIDFLVDVRN